MSTTIDLSEQELAELRSFTNQPDSVAALRSALNEYLRLARRLRLKQLSGQVSMEENWPALEASELKDRHGRQ